MILSVAVLAGFARSSTNRSPHNVHCINSKCHEQQVQGRFPPGQTGVEKTDARQNEPDDETAGGDVDIVGFVAKVLPVDIDLGRISAVGGGRVVSGLFGIEAAVSSVHFFSCS